MMMGNRRLPTLRVAEPCPIGWSSLEGDGRVRYCDVCKKDVYDLASFTHEETDALLARGKICGRIPLVAAAAIAVVAATACGEPPPHPRTIETVKIEQPAPRPTVTVTPAAASADPSPSPSKNHKATTTKKAKPPEQEIYVTGLVEGDQGL